MFQLTGDCVDLKSIGTESHLNGPWSAAYCATVGPQFA